MQWRRSTVLPIYFSYLFNDGVIVCNDTLDWQNTAAAFSYGNAKLIRSSLLQWIKNTVDMIQLFYPSPTMIVWCHCALQVLHFLFRYHVLMLTATWQQIFTVAGEWNVILGWHSRLFSSIFQYFNPHVTVLNGCIAGHRLAQAMICCCNLYIVCILT